MEGSKKTIARIGHFSSSTKNKQKRKRYHLMTENVLSNNTSNRFKFIMTPTRRKTYGRLRRNGTTTLPSRKPKTVDNMLL